MAVFGATPEGMPGVAYIVSVPGARGATGPQGDPGPPGPTITDNGDGSFTVIDGTSALVDNGDGTYTLTV